MALKFPGGKRFAFSVLDDTDGGTIENLQPVYRLLERLGMRTTKTVWPVRCPEGSKNFFAAQTLEDPDYLAFVRDLQQRGFEITWHGATMESSMRGRTIEALKKLRELLGVAPRVHANHAQNRENLYWGAERFDQPLLRRLYSRAIEFPDDWFCGHVEGSPYWWGDLCREQVLYVRNLTFNQLNVAAINPSMPYHDLKRPWVRYWFSAADADDADEFCELLSESQQQELEEQGGFCIVATHFGKQFAREGAVHPAVAERLETLARRPGWFPTCGELLDWLRVRRTSELLPVEEWRRMQWRWTRDMAERKWKSRQRRKQSARAPKAAAAGS